MKADASHKPAAIKAASPVNVVRNERKRVAKHACRSARQTAQHLMRCLVGTREVEVLDLNNYGGPVFVRTVTDSERHAARCLVTGTYQSRSARFHNSVAAAFAVAEGRQG